VTRAGSAARVAGASGGAISGVVTQCQAIRDVDGQRCESPATRTANGYKVCGRHRSGLFEMVVDYTDARKDTMTWERVHALLMEAQRVARARAAAQMVEVVRTADWLRRRLYWDRGIR